MVDFGGFQGAPSSSPAAVVGKAEMEARIEQALSELNQLRQDAYTRVDKAEELMRNVLVIMRGCKPEDICVDISSAAAPSTARSQRSTTLSTPWMVCCTDVVDRDTVSANADKTSYHPVSTIPVMNQITEEIPPQDLPVPQIEDLSGMEVKVNESLGSDRGVRITTLGSCEVIPAVEPQQVDDGTESISGGAEATSAPLHRVDSAESHVSSRSAVDSADPLMSTVDPTNYLVDQILVSCLKSPLIFNQTTLLQEEHADDMCEQTTWVRCYGVIKMPLLHPDSNVVLVWMSIGMGMIIYESVVVPYRLAFKACALDFYFVWESIINIYFIMDVFVNFCVGYYDTNHDLPQLVMDPKLISSRYLKSWFLIDVVASIPTNWFDCSWGVLRSLKLLRMLRSARALRFIRLFRLLRLAKLKPLFDKVDTFMENNGSMVLLWFFVQMCFFLWLVAHFGACCFYVVGTAFEDSWPPMEDGSPRSWISQKIPGYADSAIEHYLYGLYYVLATITTVGYGDITPVNIAEVVYSMALMGVSSLVFAGVVGIMSSTLTAVYNESQARRNRMSRLAKYMRWRAMPPTLQRNLRHYVLFVWEHNETHEEYEAELLGSLSGSMRGEVCQHVFGTVLRRAPFLAWMSSYPVCIRHMATLVNSHFYNAADLIFRYGQANVLIYFMVHGKLVISLPDEQTSRGAPEPLKQLEQPQNTSFCDVARRPLEGRFAGRDVRKAQHFNSLISDEIWIKSMKELNANEEKTEEVATSSTPMENRGTTKSEEHRGTAVQSISRKSSKKRQLQSRTSAATASIAIGRETSFSNSEASQKEHRIGFFRQTLRTPWDYIPGQQYFAAAPTFLGESTLLTLPDEPIAVYGYSAWCLSRAECVHLSVNAVHQVIVEHPFLKDRYEKWRTEARSQRRGWASERRGQGFRGF